MIGIGSQSNKTTVINNYYGCTPGGMGGMGGGNPMQMMMRMMKMMMRMMQRMSGGGSNPCSQGQFPGMPGMGGGMPGMGGGMPGMGMPGMGMPGMGMPGMGGGMPGMGMMNPMNMMGQMMGMMAGMLGGAGGCCPPPCNMGRPGGCGAMSGMMRPQAMGRGGLKRQGNSVTTPGGYKISYSGTTVNIEGMGKKFGGSQGASMAGAFAMSGPNGSMAGAFALNVGGRGGKQATGSTKIHGDPHVDETGANKSGKKKETWDWKNKTMSFNLPDGTKITMQADGPKGVVKKIDIYNGQDHVHGEGGKFQGGVSGDGIMADRKQADGDSVYAAPNGNVSNWYKNPFGMGQEVSQLYGKK